MNATPGRLGLITSIILFGILFGYCSRFLKWSFVRSNETNIEVGNCRAIDSDRSLALLGLREVSCTITVSNQGKEQVNITKIEVGGQSLPVNQVLTAGNTVSRDFTTMVNTRSNNPHRMTIQVYDEKGVLNYEEVRLR
jgi:hypothetical protein